jgi:hypothetical protein
LGEEKQMKILYVEDELAANIPRILRLFSKYLSQQEIKSLKSLEADEYGTEPEQVKQTMGNSNIIEIEYRFPNALKKIIDHPDKYVMFIIDRNLVKAEYDFAEINKIDPSFDNTQYEIYFEREGDYLLQKLVYIGVDVLTKFYFLTAYPAQDEIRGSGDIQTHIRFEKFTAENFIEKGNESDLNRLNQVIENIELLNLQNENKHYLSILQQNIDAATAESFLKILQEKDQKKRIGDNLKEIRNIYEAILKTSSEKIPGMKENCADQYGNIIIGKQTIDWLSNNHHINSIIRNFFFSVKAIASDFGSHKKSKKSEYEPTTDTTNALVYSLKDIILWFGKVCQIHKK